jgi:hypothetical protein
MATIRKLSTGTKPWQAIVRRKGTKAISKTFSTKRNAIRWANQLETEIAQGVFTDVTQAESLTFASILEKYRIEVVPQKRGQRQFLTQIRTMLSSKRT